MSTGGIRSLKELEIATKIVQTFLSTNQTLAALQDIYEINSGNEKVLLGHINALIKIFTKAKEKLEGRQNGQRRIS